MTLEPSTPAAAAGEWMSAQLAGLAQRHARSEAMLPPPAAQSALAAQAAMELQKTRDLRRQFEAFRNAAYARWWAAGARGGVSCILDEDKKELDRREEELRRHDQRLAQLDPTCEEAAYATALAARKCGKPGYDADRRKAEAFSRFVDMFPDFKHAAELARGASEAYNRNAYGLNQDMTLPVDFNSVPRGLDRRKLLKECRRLAIVYMVRYLKLVFSATPNPTVSDAGLPDGMHWFQVSLDEYAASDVSPAEFEEVAAEYSRALDAFPELVPPGDFQRLRYLAAKKKKEAYVELLSAMQRRWPNPSDVHWKLDKNRALSDLCEFFQSDPRGTSFFRWLRGKRGIGDLP
jgi:hypothetical protein